MAVLKIDSLTAGYDQGWVLQSASLELTTGLVVGLTGRNGTGKSTFFKAVLGLIPTVHGKVFLDDQLLSRRRRRKAIGWLSQEGFLPRSLGVKSLGHLLGSNNLLSQDPLYLHLKKARVSQLSEGERRYLEILFVLSLPRDFFFLDEPFTRVDPLHMAGLRDIILRRSATAGILVTDHNALDLKKVSHRRVVLDQGRIGPWRG